MNVLLKIDHPVYRIYTVCQYTHQYTVMADDRLI